MSAPALVAVAHGTRDPLGAVAVETLLRHVRAARPGIVAVPAYLDHARPTLAEAIAEVGGRAIVVPLLLSRGYHVSIDVPSLTDRSAEVTVTAPLGPHPLLATALHERLSEAWRYAGRRSASVVLAAAGSRDPLACEDARRQAAMLGGDVVVGFLSGTGPHVDEQVARLPRPVTIASYLLTSSRFHRRLVATEADQVTAPLAPHPALAQLVLRRYEDAAR